MYSYLKIKLCVTWANYILLRKDEDFAYKINSMREFKQVLKFEIYSLNGE